MPLLCAPQCPMEEARIKMVGESDWAKENVVSSIVRLIREDGILSSFRGLNAMLSKQVGRSILLQCLGTHAVVTDVTCPSRCCFLPST